MWNEGLFVLKLLELSSDNTELTVKFFWQVPNKYQPVSRIDFSTYGIRIINRHRLESRHWQMVELRAWWFITLHLFRTSLHI
jgi:hypothetical protein